MLRVGSVAGASCHLKRRNMCLCFPTCVGTGEPPKNIAICLIDSTIFEIQAPCAGRH